MIRSVLRFVLVLSLLSLSAVALAREELVDPAPLPVPPGLAPEKVAEAIKAALVGRTWTVEKQRAGHIDAALYIRKHVARIGIDYDASSIVIKYASSENLDYKEKRGKRFIHDNYLGWIQFLSNDIRRQVTNAANL